MFFHVLKNGCRIDALQLGCQRPQTGSSGSRVAGAALLSLRAPSLALMRVLAAMVLCLNR